MSDDVRADAAASPGGPFVRLRGLSKRYGRVEALRDVSLELFPGEIVGLVGDNGAGKSTLLKCLTGVVCPDCGTFEIGGERLERMTPKGALDRGITAVYQDLGLVEGFDAASNIFLGAEPLSCGLFVNRGRMHRAAAALLRSLEIALPSTRSRASSLSGGQRQSLAIARALVRSARSGEPGLIALDEPTAALGVREGGHILALLDGLRQRRFSVLCIAHNIPQILEVADRICVLRGGAVAWLGSRQETTVEAVVAWMSGVSPHV